MAEAEREKREKVINGLEKFIADFKSYCGNKADWVRVEDALALLKEHEKATIEPKRIDLTDETKAWLDKMDAVDALGNIADICMDWDGYRTANGLGGLVNEIWAYARYCADRLPKAHEPVEPKRVNRYIDFDGEGHPYNPETYECGACGKELPWKVKYCPECGRKAYWV